MCKLKIIRRTVFKSLKVGVEVMLRVKQGKGRVHLMQTGELRLRVGYGFK